MFQISEQRSIQRYHYCPVLVNIQVPVGQWLRRDDGRIRWHDGWFRRHDERLWRYDGRLGLESLSMAISVGKLQALRRTGEDILVLPITLLKCRFYGLTLQPERWHYSILRHLLDDELYVRTVLDLGDLAILDHAEEPHSIGKVYDGENDRRIITWG